MCIPLLKCNAESLQCCGRLHKQDEYLKMILKVSKYVFFFFGSDPLVMEKLHWRGNCEALWHTDDLLGCAEIIVKSRGQHPTSSPSVSVNYTRCYLWDEHYLLLIGSRAFPGLG